MKPVSSSCDIITNEVNLLNNSQYRPGLIKSRPWSETGKAYEYDKGYNTNYHSDGYMQKETIYLADQRDKRRLIIDTPFSTRNTISYGLIVYAKDTDRWAIIQRKHSVEFILFIRGMYRLTYLPILLSNITQDESNIIEKCLRTGPDVFRDVYLNYLNLSHGGLQYALIRMAESRYSVIKMLSKIDLTGNQLSWSWPKGRLNISSEKETPFECAKREFTEEVEITLPPPLFISNSYVTETFRTVTGSTIESRYWIYIIPYEIKMFPPQSHPEVSNRSWVDADTCKKLFLNDSMFKQINQLVSSLD
jgi:ADP-ribose pyrophosphatase YjhB (NUDIX family)